MSSFTPKPVSAAAPVTAAPARNLRRLKKISLEVISDEGMSLGFLISMADGSSIDIRINDYSRWVRFLGLSKVSSEEPALEGWLQSGLRMPEGWRLRLILRPHRQQFAGPSNCLALHGIARKKFEAMPQTIAIAHQSSQLQRRGSTGQRELKRGDLSWHQFAC